MQLVDPITDKKKLQELSKYLYERNIRDYIMFAVGINLGLRISDYLTKDVAFFRTACIRGYVELKQRKTKKLARVYISPKLKEVIEQFIDDKNDEEFMFTSRVGSGSKCITRQRAYDIINGAAKDVNITDKIGCHSMRKTFGYWHYHKNRNIRQLMEIFNHSSEDITKRYIGITHEEMKKSMEFMDLGIL